MPSITLRPVTLSPADYVSINYRLWNQRMSTRRSNWLLGGALTLLAISVVYTLGQNSWQLTSWTNPVLLAAGLAFLVGRGQFVRWLLRRGYEKSRAGLSRSMVYTLLPNELQGQSELVQFSLHWSAIRKAVWVEPHWLLLYPTEAACYYLDLRCLPAPTSLADVRELLMAQAIAQHEA
ncbi:hypothetical protein [Hymenobacter chitinivorans]|uniref:YcxB-like protein n=1 Tax=Hymenobacter chitinivorans DSM 11115 TaxID=1121954 RepID=A0A2M9BMK6_9BACT|nr:hypothetical protein [Hymenobacter chitinivorans]PJJ59178.1 hypothetical protein CLV45_0593 [Hymenobacter chitinivorans DSM 11115]